MPLTSTGFSGWVFSDGQARWPPVDLTGAGENYSDGRIAGAAGLEDGELRPAIDFQIRNRIKHRIEVAGLTGQIEEKVFPANERLQTVSISHVGDIDAHLVSEPLDIEEITAVLGDEAVNQGKVRSETGKPSRQVGANKAQSSRDQDFGSFELVLHRRRTAYHVRLGF